jgi:hypothetical protein
LPTSSAILRDKGRLEVARKGRTANSRKTPDLPANGGWEQANDGTKREFQAASGVALAKILEWH